MSGSVVIETKFGKLAVYQKDDCISATFKGGQFWDGPLLLPFFDKYARKDAVAIDIGSFSGAAALYLSGRVREVIAVEPVHYQLVAKTIEENRLPNVTLLVGGAYHQACWLVPAADELQGQKVAGVAPDEIDNPGGVALRRATTTEAQGGECIQAIVLDKWIDEKEDVCLIKSDAQGCDLRGLLGLVKTIERCRPAILFEFEEGLAKIHGDDWDGYRNFFAARQYDLEEQDKIGYARNWVAVPR